MKATVDAERCRGHGVCLGLCPEVFTLTDDGYTAVTVTEVPAHLASAVLDAVRECPEQAIAIE